MTIKEIMGSLLTLHCFIRIHGYAPTVTEFALYCGKRRETLELLVADLQAKELVTVENDILYLRSECMEYVHIDDAGSFSQLKEVS